MTLLAKLSNKIRMQKVKSTIYVACLFIVFWWLVYENSPSADVSFGFVIAIPLTILAIFLWQKIDKKFFK